MLRKVLFLLFIYPSFVTAIAQNPRFKVVADLRPASEVVTFSPGDKYMATAGWQGVKIYYFNNGNPKFIKFLKGYKSYVSCISFSADGRYFATGSLDKTVRIYKVRSGSFTLIKTLNDHSNSVLSVSFSPDGR